MEKQKILNNLNSKCKSLLKEYTLQQNPKKMHLFSTISKILNEENWYNKLSIVVCLNLLIDLLGTPQKAQTCYLKLMSNN